MAVVRINAIRVPEGAGPELEKRFALRAGAVDKQPGFAGFELLRPTHGGDRYFVVTHWDDEASFDAWVASQDFSKGHSQSGDGQSRPVSTDAELLSFEVVEL